MANFGNNDFLGNQKKRNFIYKPAVSLSTERNSLSRHPGSVPLQTSTGQLSPHKKLKTSHDRFGKRSEEIAVEEACRDLPLDAFDEELDAIEDDFDDDILTAEQLDECDRIASLELQSQRTTPAEDVLHQKQNVPNRFTSSRLGSSVQKADSVTHTENDEDDMRYTQDYKEQSYRTNTCTLSDTLVSGTAGVRSSSSRDRTVNLHAPLISHPNENVDIEPPISSKTDFLTVSSVDYSTESTSVANNNLAGNNLGRIASRDLGSNWHFLPKPAENTQFQSLRKEIDKLKAESVATNSKVNSLEEEKFSKDGEIKILRDSLERFHAEERRRQGEVRATQEQHAREQSEREKHLEKQVETLTTRIQFKEREISQMIEQNKKITASLTEGCNGSPQKKSVNLGEAFPTGSSFFQKSSPERTKSPKVKQCAKDANCQSKQDSPRLSEGDLSESTAMSGASVTSCSVRQVRTLRRETETIERDLAQLRVQNLPEVELVQKLLSHQEKEIPGHAWEYENGVFNENSIVSLLKFDVSVIKHDLLTQRPTLSEPNTPHTLRLFETVTQAPSRVQRSSNTILQSESSVRSGCDNLLVMQTLYELLNKSHADSSVGGNGGVTPSSQFKLQDQLNSATNFLPLLECHISQYVERRTESSDDNIMSTCLLRSSPTPESPEPKDTPGFESEHVKKLALLRQSAILSLKLLNILVVYSREVQEHILKSARVVEDRDGHDDGNALKEETEDGTRKVFQLSEEERSFSQHFMFPGLKSIIQKTPIPSVPCPLSCTEQKQGDGVDGNTHITDKECDQDVIQRTELLSCLFKLLVPQPKESTSVAYTTLQVLVSLARNCEVKYCTRLSPLLFDGLLSQCLSRDWCLTSLSLVTSLLTPLTRHAIFVRKLCSQSDDCILLKIYQGLIYRPEDVSSMHCRNVHLQIVGLLNNLLSNCNSSNLLFPLDSECHCSLELIKCLVLMLDKELTFLSPLPSDLLLEDTESSCSLMLVRQGVFLLTMLCLNDRLFVEHRVEVEHQYTNVISSVTRLYKRISHLLSETEVLAVQDLVDFEHIDGIEWTQESEDEEDETIEGMEVDV